MQSNKSNSSSNSQNDINSNNNTGGSPNETYSSPAVQVGKRRWCFKTAVLGDTGVGKTWLVETALASRQQEAGNSETQEPVACRPSPDDSVYHPEQGAGDMSGESGTIGVTFNMAKLELDGSTVLLQVWDMSGKDRYRGLLANYMTDLSCVIIAYNPCCDSAETCCQSLAQWHQFVLESSGQASMAAAAATSPSPPLFCVVAIGGGDGCPSPQTCDHVRCLAAGWAFADTLRGRFFQCRRLRHQCRGDKRATEGELTAQWLGRELLRRHFKSLARLLEVEEEASAAENSRGMRGARSCCQRLARSMQMLAQWPTLAAWVIGRRLWQG